MQESSSDVRINEQCDGGQVNIRKDVQPFRGKNKLTAVYINHNNNLLTDKYSYEKFISLIPDFVAPEMPTSNRFTPERRQTFVKHDGNDFRSDIISNIQIVSSSIEPSEVGGFTPERRQTYVKNDTYFCEVILFF